MSEHTKGRLVIEKSSMFQANDESGKIVASGIESKANARRLVACWNACDVMADPEEEIAQVMENVRVARKERDELIAALRYLQVSTAPDGQWADQAVRSFVDALLAKHAPKP